MKAVIKGRKVDVKVIENLGYNHDTGCYLAVVSHEGRELTLKKRFGVWCERTPADRVAL